MYAAMRLGVRRRWSNPGYFYGRRGGKAELTCFTRAAIGCGLEAGGHARLHHELRLAEHGAAERCRRQHLPSLQRSVSRESDNALYLLGDGLSTTCTVSRCKRTGFVSR